MYLHELFVSLAGHILEHVSLVEHNVHELHLLEQHSEHKHQFSQQLVVDVRRHFLVASKNW